MNNYLPTDYQAFIHTSRYARWIEDEGRRESWSETVDRFINQVVVGKSDSDTGIQIIPDCFRSTSRASCETRHARRIFTG